MKIFRLKKITIISIISIVVTVIATGFVFNRVKEKNDPPTIIEANFVDLSYIQKISKFRSCQGHTVVPQDESESKRNMKHYYWVKDEYLGKEISIYAPFDGRIATVMSDPENGLEGEIWISNGSDWQFSVQHIYPEKSIKKMKRVNKGQLLGYVKTNRNSFDIVYAVGAIIPKKVDGWNSPYGALDSVFNHMSDEAWLPYAEKGLKKEDLIISKESRDAEPCVYDTGPGAQAAQLMNKSKIEDWAELK